LKAPRGAWVQAINPGSPAAKAGLRGGSGEETFQGATYRQGGDVITKVGDVTVKDPDDLAGAVSRYRPGRTVAVQIDRGGQVKTVQVALAERPLGNPASSGG
jgi:S1-C subfamily serine protease